MISLKMRNEKMSKSLLFQSKTLGFSLLYLFTTIFFALYISLSSTTKCLFRSSPYDPIQSPLFSYPPNYGEHKYAIPTLRSSCNSHVHFSCTKLESPFESKGKANIFGGNFNLRDRVSYFDHSDDGTEIPCGFFKEFPVSNNDRSVMEDCERVVVVSAIFNDHDKVRQPKGLGSKTLDHVSFFMFVDDITLEKFDYHNVLSKGSKQYVIGVWRVIKVSRQHLYENAAMNGVIPKYLVHRLFLNSKYSVWIDVKLQLMVDPLLLIHSLVINKSVDLAISRHPFYVHTMEEAMATARWKKWWDVNSLKMQMETYCDNGLQPWTPHKLPYPSDVPDSALILRKHSIVSNHFSCLVFNELEGFNPREQLSFAFVRDKLKPSLKMNMFDVEVFEQVVVEYRHNLKTGRGGPAKTSRRTKRVNFNLFGNGSCESYLLKMWGESDD